MALSKSFKNPFTNTEQEMYCVVDRIQLDKNNKQAVWDVDCYESDDARIAKAQPCLIKQIVCTATDFDTYFADSVLSEEDHSITKQAYEFTKIYEQTMPITLEKVTIFENCTNC